MVAIGTKPPDSELLAGLAEDLTLTFEGPCHIEKDWLDARFAFDSMRNQYYATRLLQKLSQMGPWPGRVLGVASVDLFVPVLTFVFGEAQLDGNCAVVSHYRLAEPDRPHVLPERLTKEALHELGHTFGLRHCAEWQCVMSSSHSVERLDVKSANFCGPCRRAMSSASTRSRAPRR